MFPYKDNHTTNTDQRCVIRRLLVYITGIFGVTLLSAQVALSSPIVIYTTELPSLHQQNGVGDYDKIINRAIERSGLDAKLVFLPITRAISSFQTCRTCCISPCNTSAGVNHCPGAIVSEPFSEIKLHIFTPPNTEPLKDIQSLTNKRIGAEYGMPLGQKIESEGLNITRVETVKQAVSMFKLNRLDVFVGWAPDVPAYLRREGLPRLSYLPDAPLETLTEGIGCKGIGATPIFDAVNAVLQQGAEN